MTIDEIIYETIGAAMEVYNHLGPGLLESVYEKALMHELRLRNLRAYSQVPVEIIYKDLIVEDSLRLESS